MAGIASVGGMGSIAFQAAYEGRVAALQKEAIQQQGQEAIKLIQAASMTGANLDLSV